MASDEVNAFLSYLATDPQVSAPTQHQALAAELFLYRELLGRPLVLDSTVWLARRLHLSKENGSKKYDQSVLL